MNTAMEPLSFAVEHVSVAVDEWDRAVAVIPDTVAARLTVASGEGVRDYGYGHHESRRFPADSYETRAVRVIFEALVAANVVQHGVQQFARFGSGYFYGFVVGVSGWDIDARTWADYATNKHIQVSGGIHVHNTGLSHFGD
ncbi:hypothetical protein ACIQCR_16810 [Streptomyces sp. NPDC093249]|uniref:hypothetical protein n=1 Tax=unclassified Streptomyces TaxID=2593676 RepID=UPI00344DEA56